MSILRHWKMILGLLAIFIAGMGTGVALTIGGIMKIVSHQSKPEVWVQGRMAELRHGLKITPEQEKKMRPILEKAGERFKGVVSKGFAEMLGIVNDTHDEINQELTPEQQKQFAKLRLENFKRWQEFAKKESAKAPPKPM